MRRMSQRLIQHQKHLRYNSTMSSIDAEFPLPTTSKVVFNVSRNKVATIVLNRPEAFNALNLSMIQSIQTKLNEWNTNPDIHTIIIRGAGEKAFCAGGDVKALYKEKVKNSQVPYEKQLRSRFFYEEYRLNHTIAKLDKNYVALLDGVTMGGGVGLSVHGRYRIATENCMFAMPETALGLFPDVGGSYFLPRLKGGLGMYLALTGARLKGYDVVYAGIATHYVPSVALSSLSETIRQCNSSEEVQRAIKDFSVKLKVTAKNSAIAEHLPVIEKCFTQNYIEDIILALNSEGTEFANKTLDTLADMSPTSLRVTFEQLKRGKTMNIEDCFTMEYRIVQQFMKVDDFYEGVRSILVDKDKDPKWNPETLHGVTDEMLSKFFKPVENDLLFIH